jgi:hypothetical protein
MNEDLIERLEKRAEIRRQISTRKSVQEGKPDRIADLLEEAAKALKECILEERNRCANIAYNYKPLGLEGPETTAYEISLEIQGIA